MRTSHFRQFALADVPPKQPMPPHMRAVDVAAQGVSLWVHEQADWVLVRNGPDWVFLTGIVFHLSLDCGLEALGQRLIAAEDALDELEHWVGWFAVVYSRGGEMHCQHDATAGHKLYFRAVQGAFKWCGSDPLLSQYWGELEPHRDLALRELHASKWWNRRATMIGSMTPYEGVEQVVANHGLNWSLGRIERVFPRRERTPIVSGPALDELVAGLEHVMSMAVRDKEVHMGITAGWDSRITLAMSKSVRERIDYYTFRPPGREPDFPDIAVPRAMSAEGFSHRVLSGPLPDSHPDWSAAQASFTIANYPRFQKLLDMFPEYDPGQLVVVGSVSEVAKNYLEHIPISTGKQALRAAHLVEHPAIVSYFDRWMAKDAVFIRSMGYRPLDFLHWEQDLSNFAGAGMQYGNFSVPQFSPFNSVRVLALLLATPTEERDKYIPKLYEQFIRRAWPELMNYPVNPFLKEDAIRWMKRTGLYNPYKYLDNRLRPRPFRG